MVMVQMRTFLCGCLLLYVMNPLNGDVPSFACKLIIPGDRHDPCHAIAQSLVDECLSDELTLKHGEDLHKRHDLWRRLLNCAVQKLVDVPSNACMDQLDQIISTEGTVFFLMLEFGTRIQDGHIRQDQVEPVDKYIAHVISSLISELYDRFACICDHNQQLVCKLVKYLRKEYQFAFLLHPACIHTRAALTRFGSEINSWPHHMLLDVVAWGGIKMSDDQNRSQQAAISNAVKSKRIKSAWDSDCDDM